MTGGGVTSPPAGWRLGRDFFLMWHLTSSCLSYPETGQNTICVLLGPENGEGGLRKITWLNLFMSDIDTSTWYISDQRLWLVLWVFERHCWLWEWRFSWHEPQSPVLYFTLGLCFSDTLTNWISELGEVIHECLGRIWTASSTCATVWSLLYSSPAHLSAVLSKLFCFACGTNI